MKKIVITIILVAMFLSITADVTNPNEAKIEVWNHIINSFGDKSGNVTNPSEAELQALNYLITAFESSESGFTGINLIIDYCDSDTVKADTIHTRVMAGDSLLITGIIDAATLNTGQGDYELYAMNQDLRSTDDAAFDSLDVNTVNSPVYVIDTSPAADYGMTGDIATYTAGDTLAILDLIYMKSDGEVYKANADSTAALYPAIGICKTTGLDSSSVSILTEGYVRYDSWSWTPGAILYLSDSAGGITASAPSGTGDIVQIVGIAISATVIKFDPELSSTVQE